MLQPRVSLPLLCRLCLVGVSLVQDQEPYHFQVLRGACWMTSLPLSPSRNLVPQQHSPTSGHFSKAYFLTRAEPQCHPDSPHVSWHQSLIPNPHKSFAPWHNNDIDSLVPVSLTFSRAAQGKCFPPPLCDLLHIGLWCPQRATRRSGFAVSHPRRWRIRSKKSFPTRRLNAEMTLTTRNRIFTPKLGFAGQLSHWMGHKDSAGLKTAVICTVFNQHLEIVSVYNFSLIFFFL